MARNRRRIDVRSLKFARRGFRRIIMWVYYRERDLWIRLWNVSLMFGEYAFRYQTLEMNWNDVGSREILEIFKIRFWNFFCRNIFQVNRFRQFEFRLYLSILVSVWKSDVWRIGDFDTKVLYIYIFSPIMLERRRIRFRGYLRISIPWEFLTRYKVINARRPSRSPRE